MKIYLIKGKTGFGMDVQTWIESARVTKDLAQKRVLELNDILEKYGLYGTDLDLAYHDCDFLEKDFINEIEKIDKNFKIDDNGAYYYKIATELHGE